jgi:SAM-dependent methyltransferase
MVFLNTHRTQAETDKMYAGTKYTSDFEVWNSERYVEQAERITSLYDNGVYDSGNVLDVGCATGGLMKELVKRHFLVTGIDPSEECVAIADNPTIHGSLFNAPLDRLNVFDIVVLSHVLEHVVDTHTALQICLKRCRAIYVEVPDASRYWRDEISPYQQFNPEHINHFDLSHLKMLFDRVGGCYNLTMTASGQSTCDPHAFPTCWAFFEKLPTLRDSIGKYADRCDSLWYSIEKQIRAIKGPVICWGIGALARRLEPLLADKTGLAVDRLTTDDMRWAGGKVYRPDVVSLTATPILVTTILHEASVLADIKRLGLKNEVITLG